MKVTRREFLASSVLSVASTAPVIEIENDQLSLSFDGKSGALTALRNKLTGETYRIVGDHFGIEAVAFHFDFPQVEILSVRPERNSFTAKYRHEHMDIEVSYGLERGRNFVEKRVTLMPRHACGLKRVVLSRSLFAADGLRLVGYRHPNYDRLEAQHHGHVKRPPGTEPVSTYFGRTAKGGFFAGVEMPFDSSSLDGQRLVLAYSPNLKLKAGERFACEPVYLGVYKRKAADARAAEWRPADEPARPAGSDAVLPLPSESEAMVAMTSAVLGGRRHPSLVAMACGWHCEMEQYGFASEEAVQGDMRSLDFLAECGVDWMTDSHPWAGETEKMNALTEQQRYDLGPRVRALLEHARRLGIKVVQWSTMNNTHPWSREGRPFRPDKPEWLRVPVPRDGKSTLDDVRNKPSNCLGNAPFLDWLRQICFDAMDTGYYDGWCMDGDFWGGGGYFNSTIPVECTSDRHDHLPPDSNYACQAALDRLTAAVRERYPRTFIVMCRPPMDLGVWSQRNVDACFTLIESGSGTSNIAGGDEIRVASRIRVHHHFFPHYIDWPLLFPSYEGKPGKDAKKRLWPSEKIDYILLSALSCAPNLLLYLPTKTGIPDQDKAEIRKWLDWGRKNIAYLNVRKDLPDWPAPGKVDGSAHIVGDHGMVFLFNPSKRALTGEFALTEESIGLAGRGTFQVWQEYPDSSRNTCYRHGDTVRWEVPAESAVVLRLKRQG